MHSLSMAKCKGLWAGQIEKLEATKCEFIASLFACSYLLPRAHCLNLKIKAKHQLSHLKPNLQHLLNPNFLSDKSIADLHFWYDAWYRAKLLSKLVRSRWVLFESWIQLSLSVHYISQNPTDSHHYFLSSQILSGPTSGHSADLDWTGQCSHCKCITFTLLVLHIYLHTESHRYTRGGYILFAQSVHMPVY